MGIRSTEKVKPCTPIDTDTHTFLPPLTQTCAGSSLWQLVPSSHPDRTSGPQT